MPTAELYISLYHTFADYFKLSCNPAPTRSSPPTQRSRTLKDQSTTQETSSTQAPSQVLLSLIKVQLLSFIVLYRFIPLHADVPESSVHGVLTEDGYFDGHISTPLEQYYIEPAKR